MKGPLHGDVKFYTVRYSKADLEQAGEAESILFLIACHLHNDIAGLFRILLANSGKQSEFEPAAASAISIQLLVFRMLSGRLHEGWIALTSKAGAPIKEALPELPAEARGDFAELGKYFGGGRGLIQRLRNKISFHSDIDVIREAFRKALRNCRLGIFTKLTLEIHCSTAQTNSYFARLWNSRKVLMSFPPCGC